jgi:hypothetical protein
MKKHRLYFFDARKADADAANRNGYGAGITQTAITADFAFSQIDGVCLYTKRREREEKKASGTMRGSVMPRASLFGAMLSSPDTYDDDVDDGGERSSVKSRPNSRPNSRPGSRRGSLEDATAGDDEATPRVQISFNFRRPYVVRFTTLLHLLN